MVQSTCDSMTDLCEYDGNFVHKLNKFVEPVDDMVMFIVDQWSILWRTYCEGLRFGGFLEDNAECVKWDTVLEVHTRYYTQQHSENNCSTIHV